MHKSKGTAFKLRLQGKSYNEISKFLGIPKSTLSGWFRDLALSDSARERLQNRVYTGSHKGLLKRNRLQTHLAQQRARQIRQSSSKEIGLLSKRDLFIAGVCLYWGEGYKRPIKRNGKIRTSHPVGLTNSDPYLVKIFLRFLREICNVHEEKIKAAVRIYQHHNEQNLLKFWSELTHIPKHKFEKFYYGVSKSSLGKRPYNTLRYGTIQIRIGDTKLYHRIMGWIEGF